jgi:hypothetical protein
MTSNTPMFPGWHRKLYGRRPVRPGVEMQHKAVDLSSLCLRQAKDLFGDLLAIGLLVNVPGFRNRSFPLSVVFWTFVCQILANGSCRHGVASVQAFLSRQGEARSARQALRRIARRVSAYRSGCSLGFIGILSRQCVLAAAHALSWWTAPL